MDKKKLIEYTEWLIHFRPSKPRRTAKQIVKGFLKQNPNFFDEQVKSPDNQSQTGSFLITYKIKEL